MSQRPLWKDQERGKTTLWGGPQTSSDETCLEQTKARLCRAETPLDHFDLLALPVEAKISPIF